jgi:hypothetical protein
VYFDRLGRSLSDDEYIELRPENLQRPARLNKTTRKKLLLSLPQVQEYSEEIEIKGLIPEIDQEKKTFLFALSNGTRIAAPFDSIYREEILKAFNAYEAGQKVLIKGIGRFNRTEKLQRLESVEDISLIDALDIAERLEELSRLEDGWMDGKGKAPEKKDLEWLDETFDLNYDTALPLPRLFPTAEGGIQAEWSIGSWEITLEFDLPKRRGTVQAVNLATAAELNQEYDLSDENSWKSINEIIKNCREGIA